MVFHTSPALAHHQVDGTWLNTILECHSGHGGGQAPLLHDCDPVGLTPAQNESATVIPELFLHSTVAVCVPRPQLALQAPYHPICQV